MLVFEIFWLRLQFFRIGQTKDVKIYRLITRNTYEERLFECSSRKYGLDEAILGNRLGADAHLDHDKNIESLLKHGAYDIMKVLRSINFQKIERVKSFSLIRPLAIVTIIYALKILKRVIFQAG